MPPKSTPVEVVTPECPAPVSSREHDAHVEALSAKALELLRIETKQHIEKNLQEVKAKYDEANEAVGDCDSHGQIASLFKEAAWKAVKAKGSVFQRFVKALEELFGAKTCVEAVFQPAWDTCDHAASSFLKTGMPPLVLFAFRLADEDWEELNGSCGFFFRLNARLRKEAQEQDRNVPMIAGHESVALTELAVVLPDSVLDEARKYRSAYEELVRVRDRAQEVVAHWQTKLEDLDKCVEASRAEVLKSYLEGDAIGRKLLDKVRSTREFFLGGADNFQKLLGNTDS